MKQKTFKNSIWGKNKEAAEIAGQLKLVSWLLEQGNSFQWNYVPVSKKEQPSASILSQGGFAYCRINGDKIRFQEEE